MLAATADELLTIVREELDDAVIDLDGGDAVLLWKNREIYRALTEGLDRFAKDTLSLYKVWRNTFVAGQQDIDLPSYILHIREARVTAAGAPVTALRHRNANEGPGMRQDYGSWICDTGRGTPTAFVRDYERRAIKLYPVPATDGAIELQCTVTIGAPLDEGVGLPIHDIEDQRLVIEFAKHRLYQKPESDTNDPQRAAAHLQAYTVGVAARKAAVQNMRRAPGVVRMEWF